MSYIAFDLDALNVARDVGAAAGVPEERITHGLLRMWAWCFREKTDTVQAIQVQGFFGADAGPALMAFGFLAESANGFRVRGAERYLRVSEARSKGGRAASGNLKRGTLQPKPSRDASPGSSPAPAGNQPGVSPGSAPALTPSTEHRAPNTKRLAPVEPTQPRDSDLLCADFRDATGTPYAWQGAKDGVALAALLKVATIDEVRQRWREGLRHPPDKWRSARTVAQLRAKWNDLAPTAEGPRTVREADFTNSISEGF